jgi:type VI secretion system protein ImpH
MGAEGGRSEPALENKNVETERGSLGAPARTEVAVIQQRLQAGAGSTQTVEEKLFAEPFRFQFFQALRLLERLFPERLPVGRVSEEGQVIAPSREVARFRTHASLCFPPSQVHDLMRGQSGAGLADVADTDDVEPAQMEVAFMGLTGPLGVLPNVYTELLIDRKRRKDRALHEFLDLFNHRFISFFYRAWEKYRFPVAYERNPGEGQFTSSLFAIINSGTRGLRNRMSLPDEGLLCYGGLIAQRPHSVSAIAAIIGDYFGTRACIEQFFGQWLKLDAESVSRLGRANNSLGASAVAGMRVWDSQSKFRVKLGPMSYEQFVDFLPPGSAFKPVMDLIRLLAGPEFDFDLQLVLRADEVPESIATGRAKGKSMLGWNSWLKTRAFSSDDEQVVLSNAA